MKTLVAGIGNIFNRDDAFGSEVARRLRDSATPDGVRIEDYGIRGMHLALDLLEGYDLLILIDALAGHEAPGTLRLIEPDRATPAAPTIEAHQMDPDTVLNTLAALGGEVDRVLVVGCQPESLDYGVGLSPPVQDAVEPAVRMVEDLLARL